MIKRQYIPIMNTNEGFELFFIEAVVEMVERSGTPHRVFGDTIFGNDNGARIWSRTRKPGKKETRRSLRLEEAARIATFFNKDLPTFIWEIYNQKRQKESARS